MLSCMSLVLEVCLVVSWFDSSPILGDAKGGGGGGMADTATRILDTPKAREL